MTAAIHPLQIERERLSAELAEELKQCAEEIVEHRKGDIAGFVIVSWGELDGITTQTRVYGGRVSSALVPTMVTEAVRQDIIRRQILQDLGQILDEGGSDAS